MANRNMTYPRFRKGTRVRVIHEPPKVPAWATTGVVVYNPPPGGDYYEHPLVLWDSDNRKRHVPDSWLEKANPHSNFIPVTCRCPRTIRVALSTLEKGPISCEICRREFT